MFCGGKNGQVCEKVKFEKEFDRSSTQICGESSHR